MPTLNARDWRGDFDDTPHFGRAARQWFARSVREKLSGLDYRLALRIDVRELEALTEWFANDPCSYVSWKNVEHFSGKGYSAGAWVINWEGIDSVIRNALRDIRSELRFASLDDWLKADIADTVPWRGTVGGSRNLPPRLRRELRVAARARRKKLPRICRTCRSEFTPTCNRARRCTRCIEAAH